MRPPVSLTLIIFPGAGGHIGCQKIVSLFFSVSLVEKRLSGPLDGAVSYFCSSVPLLHCFLVHFSVESALMKRGASRGRSRSTASGSGHSPPPPPSLALRVSPSRGTVQPDVAAPRSTHGKVTSVERFLDTTKSLADQLTQSDFDLATAQIQAAKRLLPKPKIPFSPPLQHVRSAHSRIRRGLATTSTVAVRSSVVDSLIDILYPLSKLVCEHPPWTYPTFRCPALPLSKCMTGGGQLL